VNDDRIAELESRLARLQAELHGVRGRLSELEGRSRGVGLRSRLLHVPALIGLCELVLVAALGLGTASAAPQYLTVQGLRVVGSAGLAAQLDSGGLFIYRANRIVSQVGATADGAGLIQVFNSSGNRVAALQTTTNGYGELVVGGADGKARLGVDQGSLNQTLRFYNGNNVVAGIGIVDGSGLLQVNDASGRKMATLANNGATGALSIYDSTAQTRINVSSSKGLGAIDIYNASGGPAISMAEHPNGGYLGLTNSAGIGRVEAGVLPSDRGVVRTFGPGGFNYIEGRK
jgi:hypothetical protein